MHAERNICCDFLFASEKETTAGLDAVEPKVLLRTVDPGSIPEFRGGLSEEPLVVFVLSCRDADVGPVTSEISMSTDGTQYSIVHAVTQDR